MKKIMALCFGVIIILSIVGCSNNKQSEEKNDSERSLTFKATIIEMGDNYFTVEPVEGSLELNSANRIEIPMEHMVASPEPQIGNELEITYCGGILETYPARLAEVKNINVID